MKGSLIIFLSIFGMTYSWHLHAGPGLLPLHLDLDISSEGLRTHLNTQANQIKATEELSFPSKSKHTP